MRTIGHRVIPEGGRWLRTFDLLLNVMIVIFAVTPLFGQTCISGGTGEEQRELERLIEKTDYPANLDSVRIYLTDRGYFDADISHKDDSTIIRFGQKYRIGRVIIRDDQDDTVSVGRVFEQEIIERAIRDILNDFRAKGHFYANIQPAEYIRREGFIDIIMELQIGPLITVSDVELKGLKQTDPNHIARYIDIKSDDTLTGEALEDSYRRLQRLDYVALDSSPEIIPEQDYSQARIVYNFSESKRVFVEGSGGYVPEDDGYFMWYFNSRLRNIFGQGKYVELFVDRREKNNSIFRAGYNQPIFLFGRGRAGFAILTRDYRKQFYEFGVRAFYDFELTGRTSLGLNLEWKDVEPDNDLSPSYNMYGIGLTLESGEVISSAQYDFQNSLKWKVTYLSRRYDIKNPTDTVRGSTFEDTRIELTAEISKRLLGSIHGYGRLLVNDVESTEKPLPLSEVVLFGGPGTIRGYRNDRYGARRLFAVTLEQRLFWDDYSYMFPFFDAAYYEYYRLDGSGAPVLFDDFISGYGLGASLGSASRALSISLSWGEDTAFDEPRLNITVSDQF